VTNREALVLAMIRNHNTDGGHHKQWLLDRIVRVLTGCPTVTRTGVDHLGRSYEYEDLGESDEYKKWVLSYEGNGDYTWDVGVPP